MSAQAKSRVPHGAWLPWVEANCPLSERQAQDYMRLARNPRRVADLPSIREAVALLTEPREEPERRDGLPTRGQAEAFTAAAGGWIAEAVEAALMDEPPPPEFPLPPDTHDHIEMARYWLACADHASETIRRAARRALLIAVHGKRPDTAAYARVAAVGLALADAEPFDPDYERLSREWGDALGELDPDPPPEADDDPVMAAMRRLWQEMQGAVTTR
jgi:hypothetical protein